MFLSGTKLTRMLIHFTGDWKYIEVLNMDVIGCEKIRDGGILP
jgi:hypothetical protein